VGKDSPQTSKLIHGNDWNNVAPSFGFSWSVPYFKHVTVLRGGYGINYAAAPDFLALNTALGNLPGNSLNASATTFNVPGGYLDLTKAVANASSLFPLSTGTTVPLAALPLNGINVGSRGTTIYGYADNYLTPYIQSFNLSIQRELTRDLTFDVGWVGNKASKLYRNHNINDVNVIENGILDAFNAVRSGQNNVALMDQLFNGVNLGSGGVVGPGNTAAQALRKSTLTGSFIANGNVGAFANFINTTTIAPGANAGKPGGLLLNGNLPQNFIVVSPQFGTVNLSDNTSNSSYQSFLAHVTKRTSHGVSGQFSYTFSKGMGDNGIIRDYRNLAASRSVLSIDRTHAIVSNATYDLPFGKDRLLLANTPGWLDRVVGGWQVSSILSWFSGAPLSFAQPFGGLGTLYNGASNTFDQVAALPKGEVVKGQTCTQSGSCTGYISYFNTLQTQKAPQPTFGGDVSLPTFFTNQVLVDASGNTLMQQPNPGRIGNLSFRSSNMRGPGQLNFNAAVTKQIRISENKMFTLRADAVNVLNKPQWGDPSTNISSTTFGRITTAGGNRSVTLNARIDF
jgi:hypothetical protein